MRLRKYILLFFAIILMTVVYGQSSFKDMPEMPEKYKNFYPAHVDGLDTIILVKMRPIVIMPPPKFTSRRQWRRYWRLVYNIKKVYPYAKLINYYYYEVEETIKYMDEKERQKYLKDMEKYLRKKFEDDLINLTYTQGRLLIKLVDRETEHTTYEVIEEFKGEMSAQFWQAFARIFGSNLKVEYNPKDEDRLIEYIISRIENGQM